MIIQALNRPVVANRHVAQFCQFLCSIVGGLVMVFGIRRLGELELSEAQLFSATTETLLLSGMFIMLGFLCRAALCQRAGAEQAESGQVSEPSGV